MSLHLIGHFPLSSESVHTPSLKPSRSCCRYSPARGTVGRTFLTVRFVLHNANLLSLIFCVYGTARVMERSTASNMFLTKRLLLIVGLNDVCATSFFHLKKEERNSPKPRLYKIYTHAQNLWGRKNRKQVEDRTEEEITLERLFQYIISNYISGCS